MIKVKTEHVALAAGLAALWLMWPKGPASVAGDDTEAGGSFLSGLQGLFNNGGSAPPPPPRNPFRNASNRLRALNPALDVTGGREQTLAGDLARGLIPL